MAIFAGEKLGNQFQIFDTDNNVAIQSNPAPTAILQYGTNLATSQTSASIVAITFDATILLYTARFDVPNEASVGDTIWLTVTSDDRRAGDPFVQSIPLGTITSPTSITHTLPISVADVKRHIVLDTDTDDAYVESLILSAQRKLENDSRVLLVQSQQRMTTKRLDDFVFDYAPIVSIDSIQYYNESDELQTYPDTNYTLERDLRTIVFRNRFIDNIALTYTRNRPFVINYTAGYIIPNNNPVIEQVKIPADLIHALRMLISYYYDNRSAVGSGSMKELPLGYKELINAYNSNI